MRHDYVYHLVLEDSGRTETLSGHAWADAWLSPEDIVRAAVRDYARTSGTDPDTVLIGNFIWTNVSRLVPDIGGWT